MTDITEQFVITHDMKPINVGLLGIGTVGGGTFAVLKRNQEEITRRAGRGIVIRMVADREQREGPEDRGRGRHRYRRCQ